MEFGFCLECNTLTPTLLCDDCAAQFEVEWVKSPSYDAGGYWQATIVRKCFLQN